MKRYFRYATIVFAVLLCAIALTSCLMRPQSDREKTNQQLERVISAIQNEDVGYLESLFSKKALWEVENFNSGVQRLFDFFDGDVLSYEFKAQGIDDSKSDGLRTTKKRWWYSVNTSAGEYLFFFLEYPRDDSNPDNVGLYMLQVIKAEDRDTLFDGGQTILYPGIYVPEEYLKDYQYALIHFRG